MNLYIYVQKDAMYAHMYAMPAYTLPYTLRSLGLLATHKGHGHTGHIHTLLSCHIHIITYTYVIHNITPLTIIEQIED